LRPRRTDLTWKAGLRPRADPLHCRRVHPELLGNLAHARAARLGHSGPDISLLIVRQRGAAQPLALSLGSRKPGADSFPWIMARSNSANTPIMPNMALPPGVVRPLLTEEELRSLFYEPKWIKSLK
jgi:hypothetical protein